MNLGNDRWHTFAVEVTKTHISWFVDAHVMSTERRSRRCPASRYGAVRDGRRARQADELSRMQMDWLRYHTLRKPNTKSIAAPAPTAGRYAGAC